MENKKSQRDFDDVVLSVARFLKALGEEILSGIINNRVPFSVSYFGIVVAVLLYRRADVWAVSFFVKNYQPPLGLRNFLIYASLASGWLLWGGYRAVQRNKLLSKLRDAFEAANLKCNGRYPSLIEDLKVDSYVRRLRLKCHGVTKTEFETAISRLESVLNVVVVRILQDEQNKSTVEIIYTAKDLVQTVSLENPDSFADGEIPIGISHEGPIHVNMRNVGHILVAGQTGGGKSNFLKTVTTVLTKNNPEARVIFLDFKGGMESADIRNHARNLGTNIKCFEGTKSCADELANVGGSLEARLQEIAAAGAADFDSYLKNLIGHEGPRKIRDRPITQKRTFVVIDEIAQLFARDPEVDKETLQKARAAVNRISRQGRAAGVHLIVATQKPDAQSFDQTVKTNLPAVLCFPMPNQASSISALGTKRAFELNPNIKGRAVWKFGPKLAEVQTYLFG